MNDSTYLDDIAITFRALKDGLNVYQNMCELGGESEFSWLDVCITYDSFGQENLVLDTVDKLKAFLIWLKNKICEYAKYLITWIKRVFTSKTKDFNGRTLFSKALSDIDQSKKYTGEELIQIPCHPEVYLNGLKQFEEDPINFSVDAYLVGKNTGVTISRRELYNHSMTLDGYFTLLETKLTDLQYIIQKFGDAIKTDWCIEEFKLELQELNSRLSNEFVFIKDAKNTFQKEFYQMTRADVVAWVNNLITVSGEMFNKYKHVYELTLSYCKCCLTVYSKGTMSLHINAAFPQDLLKNLQQLLKGKLVVRRLVFTTLSPASWETDTGRITPNSGWTYASTNSNTVDLWISIPRLLKSNSPIDLIRGKRPEDDLLDTIVHECTHLFDSQTGIVFDPNDTGPKSRQERRAYNTAAEYLKSYITESDRRWARNVIARIRQMVRR